MDDDNVTLDKSILVTFSITLFLVGVLVGVAICYFAL